MEQVLLLAARRYSFQDSGGRAVEGVQLQYATGGGQETPDRRGLELLTVSAPLELMTSLREVPGVYAMEFRQRPGLKGRPTLQVVSLAFREGVELPMLAG